MTNPNVQLIAVTEQFKQWRQAKSHPTAPVPESLRRQVVALAEQFGTGKIKSALALSCSVLHRWKKQLNPNAVDVETIATVQTTDETPEFVVLSNDKPPASSSLVLELHIGNQCQIRLSGDISTAHLDVVTRNIFMYQNGSRA